MIKILPEISERKISDDAARTAPPHDVTARRAGGGRAAANASAREFPRASSDEITTPARLHDDDPGDDEQPSLAPPLGSSAAEYHFGVAGDDDASSLSLSPREPQLERPARVLVVEDEALIAISVQSYLEESGFHVVDVKATGADALDALARAQAAGEMPDIVLMDITLRGAMDGIDTATQIRERYGALPIVYLTGQADPATRQRAQATAPAAYLVKPCAPSVIESAIKRILGAGTGQLPA